MRRIYVLLMLCVVVNGCGGTKEVKPYYVKPLNSIQREFYDIQTMYESKKYEETIALGTAFTDKYQRDVLTVAVYYFVAASYQHIGKIESANGVYQMVCDMKTGDEWEKLAMVGLEEIKELRGDKQPTSAYTDTKK